MIADASMTDGLGIWYGEFGYAGEVVELLLVGFFFFVLRCGSLVNMYDDI